MHSYNLLPQMGKFQGNHSLVKKEKLENSLALPKHLRARKKSGRNKYECARASQLRTKDTQASPKCRHFQLSTRNPEAYGKIELSTGNVPPRKA